MLNKCSLEDKRIIIIGGVPGSGKTTVAKKLSEKLKAKYINVSAYAIENNFLLEYDKKRETYVIDEERLVENLISHICSLKSNYVILDTHYGEIFPKDIVSIYFILRINPKKLFVRLRNRGWSSEKIKENIAAEILGTITANAINAFGREKICEVNVTSRSLDEIVNEIFEIIIGKRKCEKEKLIDWTLTLDFSQLEPFLR